MADSEFKYTVPVDSDNVSQHSDTSTVSGKSEVSVNSSDPIYQYVDCKGKVKTRKFTGHLPTKATHTDINQMESRFINFVKHPWAIVACVVLCVMVGVVIATYKLGKWDSVSVTDHEGNVDKVILGVYKDSTVSMTTRTSHLTTTKAMKHFSKQRPSTQSITELINQERDGLTSSKFTYKNLEIIPSPQSNLPTVTVPAMEMKTTAAAEVVDRTVVSYSVGGTIDNMQTHTTRPEEVTSASLDGTTDSVQTRQKPYRTTKSEEITRRSTQDSQKSTTKDSRVNLEGIRSQQVACDFETSAICGFTQDNSDDFDWTRDYSGTSSLNTGPYYDHSEGTSYGYYMYIEATGQNTGDTARLQSTNISPSVASSCLEFWYHMYGSEMGTLNVYATANSYPYNQELLVTRSGNRDNYWRFAQIPYINNSSHVIEFEGIRGTSFTSDIAIDDVWISSQPCGPPSCGGNITLQNGEILYITSPNYPNDYLINDNCVWFVHTMLGDLINITIHNIDIAYVDRLIIIEETDIVTMTDYIYSSEYSHSGNYFSETNKIIIDWTSRYDSSSSEGWMTTVAHLSAPSCNPACINGTCRYSDDYSTFCECTWPYSGISCDQATPATYDVTCDFEDADICGITQSMTGGYQWLRVANYSSLNGVIHDHTTGYGYYMHFLGYSGSAYLFTPIYSSTHGNNSVTCVAFWYQADGSVHDSFELNVNVIDRIDNESLGMHIGSTSDQTSDWTLMRFLYSRNQNPFYSVVIAGHSNYIPISIDDLTVHSGPCECQDYDFQCEDGNGCLPWQYACNGISECQDGSDERICGICGGDVYIPAYGSYTINSPGYPNPYPSYCDCRWRIHTDVGYSMIITIQHFSVRHSDAYLYIYNGANETSSAALSLTGSSSSQLPTHGWRSTYNDVFLHFTSSYYYNVYSGWEIRIVSQLSPTRPPFGTICDFEDDFICSYDQDTMDDFDWTRISGSTPSGSTGPSGDHTTTRGFYMYIEASSAYYNSIARLNTYAISKNSNASCLQLWYHMYGSNMGTFNVYIDDFTNSTLIMTRSGNLGNYWRHAVIMIPYTSSERYRIVFEGVRGTSYYSDLAIDDVQIFDQCDYQQCGGTFMLGSEELAIITSPGHPNKYDINDNCLIYVVASDSGDLRIIFNTFDSRRNYDYLDIGVGNDAFNASSRVLHHSGSVLPDGIYAAEGSVWIDWMTYNYYYTNNYYTGFNLTVENVPKCIHIIRMSLGQHNHITSKNYPDSYENLHHCTWIVSSEEGVAINVHFLEFNTQFQRDNLSLGIGDSPSLQSQVVMHSGSTIPDDWISETHTIWIQFATDASITYRGFRLELEAVKYCENIGIPFCEPYLPYGGSQFYSPFGLTRQQTEQVIDRTREVEGCHEYIQLFMCSLLSPECAVNGTYRQPCRAFCDDVRSACEDTMHFGGLVWPVNCSSLPSPVEAVDCIRITPCLSFPCQHNGTCLATSEQNYTCACEAGYIGHQCEIDFDECSSTPCANGGTCIDGINDYTCFCSIGYTGQQCDCVDITIESCQYLDLNYARLASFSRSRSNNQGIRDFIQSLQYERAGCYEHIGFFMCALLAPECSDEGYYRPPCNYFCEIARSECEPKFNTGGIRWPIDCDVLPNNNDSAVCVPDPNVAAGSGLCGRRLFGSDRIVGGMAAQLGSWPWQVSVLRHGSHICGAVIIDPNWILTAAHCVDGYSASSYELRMGFISQADSVPTEIRRSVNEIIMHPVYEYPPWYNDYDVALFRVEPAIEYTEYIRPACLPPANDLSFFHAGELCTVSGWGFLYDGGYVANSLQEAEINLWDQATCNSMLNSNILDSYICAGGPGAGSASTCSGDSGGPLICKKANGRWYLAGITSWHESYCGAKPHIYSRVTSAITWIETTIMQCSLMNSEMAQMTTDVSVCPLRLFSREENHY